MQTMNINFASLGMYQYRMMFLREKRIQERWRIDRMQLTALSPIVTLVAIEIIYGKGAYCQGPNDPWNYVEGVMMMPHAIYWIPSAVYCQVPLFACREPLRAQVSTCPYWAYSTPKYRVRFLVHQLINFNFPAN
ncbi:MAG: hypothetical protein GY843_04380 [Neptuniibacter sp.]|nr:hypothetical protein [Neptuniibacter sp.]